MTRLARILALALTLSGLVVLPASSAEQTNLPKDVFATIDGDAIEASEFVAFASRFARQKLYHGGSEERLRELRVEAADALILRRLLLRQAKRRDIAGDSALADRNIEQIKVRYGKSESWAKIEPELPKLRQHYLDESRLEVLEKAVRETAPPDDDAVEEFYQANPRLFTEPEKLDISVIHIGVEPWQSTETWQAAKATAEELRTELLAGKAFAEIAQQHSTHESAQAGGRLGPVHRGAIDDAAEKALDKLEPGQITAPVRLLSGYALFRLEAVLPEKVYELSAVRERAAKLFVRERSDAQWRALGEKLRSEAEIVINESVVTP